MERTKSTPPLVFHEPIIFSLENHLVNVLSITLLFSLLLSLEIFLSFDLHPLVLDVIGCLYYSVLGILCPFLLPYLKKMCTLMVQIRDTNPKKLPTTFCERAIFINDMFLYICVLLPLLVVFDDWSFELDLPDSHLIGLFIILHLVLGLIAYFLGEILQTIGNMDGTRGGPFHLILLVSIDCSDELDHPAFFVLFMGLFIIFHRFLTPKMLAIYPKIKGIISDLLKFVRGENREEKPLADSDSTNNRTYQSSLLFSNSGKTSAREASKGARMAEGVLSSVDSTTRISSSNSDAKRVRETFFIDLLSIFLLFSPIFPLSYFLSLDLPTLVVVVLLFFQGSVFLLSFFVSCIVFNKWYTVMVLKLKMIAIYPKNKCIISVLLKFVRGKNREEKPLVDFYCRARQSGLLASNSEKTNAREAIQGVCMREGVLSLVDSTTIISSRDFDAPDCRAHLGRANKSGPIMLNSEKKDTSEGLNGECLIKSVLSLDDSTKQKSFLDFGATENKAHLVRAYQSGPVVSLSENKNREEALKRECITKSILGLEDLQQHCCGRCDAAAKSFCAICDPGLHTTDSLTWKSFEVLENLMPSEQLRNAIDADQARQIQTQMCREPFDARGGHPIHVDTYFGWLRTHLCLNLCDAVCIHSIFGEQTIDFVPLLSLRKLTLKGCIRQEKSPYLPWKTLALKCWVRLKKSQDLPRTLQMKSSGGLTSQSASSLHWPIGLTDGGQVVPVPEKKIVTIKTFKRKCRTMSASFEDHNRHCCSRCKGAANRLGVKRRGSIWYTVMGIHWQHVFSYLLIGAHAAKRRGSIWYTVKGIHWQHVIHWCPFRQGYSLGGERPAEVISLSMEEELVSRLKFLSVYGVRRLCRLALPSGSKSVGHIFLSSEFAATNNRTWGRQDRCGSSASRPEKETTRETPNWEGIASRVITFEHLQQRFGSKREDVAKSLGISVSTLKRVCRHHGIQRWPNRIRNRVLRPPDPLGEKNPSPTFKTLSTIEQITVDNEMGCQNPKPNEFQPDSFEDLNFQNTEIGSIAEMLSDWDFLALEEEPSLEGHVSGSVNLTVAACSDPAPCQHPMPTIPDTMTTTHMMPHLAAKGDVRFVTLKVTYGKKIIKFQFPLMSGIIELKEEVKKRLKLELDSFDIEYKDEDGDCIFLGCDEDLRNHLQLFSNQVIRLLVVDSDANTANFG